MCIGLTSTLLVFLVNQKSMCFDYSEYQWDWNINLYDDVIYSSTKVQTFGTDFGVALEYSLWHMSSVPTYAVLGTDLRCWLIKSLVSSYHLVMMLLMTVRVMVLLLILLTMSFIMSASHLSKPLHIIIICLCIYLCLNNIIVNIFNQCYCMCLQSMLLWIFLGRSHESIFWWLLSW